MAVIKANTTVNDAVEGMFGAPEPQLTVNGVDAQVADRFFQISDVPLQQGINTLTIRATDHLGNVREQTLQVIRADLGLAGLILESGHNQTALANTELPAPLSVLALNDKGEPVPNLAVSFEVLRGTGSVSPTQGQSASGDPHYTSRIIQVTTDQDGRAQAWYTVGKQSGPGANTVRASAIGYTEDALFTANTQRGAVARISGDFGVNQISETGVPSMEILSAVVRDADSNPLPNVAVKFIIDEGQAYFTDTPGVPAAADGQSITVFSDKNGVVAARPTLGNTPGTVRISALALKTPAGDFSNSVDTVGGATYIIRAKAAQVGPASFNGTLYTDKGAPLAGARVSIGRTPLQVTSDANGYFEINDVPPGRIDLFVDGRTANPTNDPARPQYPSLHFEAYVVRGQINQLPHPIYLPPLLASEAKIVGGNQDVILTMPGLEGFQMKVKANSVTFPDGSRVGTLIVSPVAADRLPMAPPAGGAQFGIPAWTVQPAGTRFDPPIEVQMPNTTGETPGFNLPVVQWDHDLAQYVPMGRATVTGDGAYLITDAGSGLTKAGWGGLCRYDPCKLAIPKKCPECQTLDSSAKPCPTCKNDDTQKPKEICKKCQNGGAVPDAAMNDKACEDGPAACDIDKCKDGTCDHKEVTAVSAYGPPDSAPAGNLTAATSTARTCLENAVTAAGGTCNVTTTYRSQEYQNHLVQVWDKVKLLDNWSETECATVKANHATEKGTHFPMGAPARRFSNHTNGTAFDATVTLPADSTQDVGTLATGCNLTRPDPLEPWHFER